MKQRKAIALIAVLMLMVQTIMAQVTNNSVLNETLWRNEQTGDWEIGFFEEFAVYDCQFWEYKDIKEKADRYDITLRNGCEQLVVSVGKVKGSKPQMSIGSKKQKQLYSQITTKHLPDYPTKDFRTDFKDNGFHEGDSITFVGWLRHLPKKAMEHLKELDCRTYSIFDERGDGTISAIPFDSLLRFRLRIPIENTTMLMFRMHPFIVEPGETYFFYVDYKTKQTMFMGRNVRLQNELLAHDFNYVFTKFEDSQFDPDSLSAFRDKINTRHRAKQTELKTLLESHPMLSERFRLYNEGMLWSEYSNRIGQGCYSMPRFCYPDSVLDWMKTELWDKMPKPYSLFAESSFLRDFLDMSLKKVPGYEEYDVMLKRVLTEAARKSEVKMSEEELLTLGKFFDARTDLMKQVWALNTDDERDSLVQLFNKEYAAEVAAVQEVMGRKDCSDVLNRELGTIAYNSQFEVLDSLGANQTLRDICLARRLLREIDEKRQPLHESLIPRIELDIHNEAMRNLVLQKQRQFVALQHGDLAGAASLRPSSDVEGMTDGEKILRKLIEPYKERLVYIDVWGTWCGPCKEALSRTHELKEALKDHDIVYLYLANRSPEESWKNVIKQYQLTGENCVHYNLPANQQAAVERYLSVHSFPTYKLIDKQGNIHDLDWHHQRDLKLFEQQISQFDK